MTRPPVTPPVSQRLLLTAVAAGSMGLAILAVYRAVSHRPEVLEEPDVAPIATGAPIEAEAASFRASVSDQAVQPDAQRRATAHPRTLRTERLLRSYPGAPPRIPHGLRAEELRTSKCLTCHARGGFSLRFESYVPVTPHPQWTNCVQCHAMNDELVVVPALESGPNASCRECHVGKPSRFAETGIDWRSAAWPTLSASGDLPPPIPHDLQSRANCLPCHAGPGAIEEIRTTHPERVDCRSCHVLASAPADETFSRPGGLVRRGGGTTP